MSTYLCDAGTGEGDDDCHDVDRQLELEEFRDAVVDVTSPHDGLDDAGEVIVGQDDVRSFLSNVSSSDALQIKMRF